MEYVDGGYYITNNQLKAAIVGAGVTGLINAATIKAACYLIGATTSNNKFQD